MSPQKVLRYLQWVPCRVVLSPHQLHANLIQMTPHQTSQEIKASF